jgi:hypothetical protein
MSARATEPPSPLDAYSKGDMAIGHSLEAAREYREASAKIMQQREAGIPSGQSSTPAPAGRPLPSIAIARHYLGKEISSLSLQAESLHRQAEAQPLGVGNPFSGAGNPYLADVHRGQEAMKIQARNQLASVRAELKRLEGLDDLGAQNWAYDRGRR